MTDVRESGIPDVEAIVAGLTGEGDLRKVQVRVAVPDGGQKQWILAWFKLDEGGEAVLDRITGSDGRSTDPDDLKKLSMSVHLPGIIAAEMAVSDLDQVESVRTLRDHLPSAESQAQEGWWLTCEQCGYETSAREAIEAAPEDQVPKPKMVCPECGAKQRKLKPAL